MGREWVCWFLGFLVSKFLGFLVAWFLGFLVSKFIGFLASKFLGFKVSRLRSFLVSKFLGFKVSWLLGFKVSKFQSFKVSMIPYYQNLISCFLKEIDPISKLFKNLLDGSSGFVGACLFYKIKVFDFQFFEISKPNMF